MANKKKPTKRVVRKYRSADPAYDAAIQRRNEWLEYADTTTENNHRRETSALRSLGYQCVARYGDNVDEAISDYGMQLHIGQNVHLLPYTNKNGERRFDLWWK